MKTNEIRKLSTEDINKKIVERFKKEAKENGAVEIFANVPISAVRFAEKNGLAVDGVSFPKGETRFVKCSYQFIFDDANWVRFHGEKDAVIARKDFYVETIKEFDIGLISVITTFPVPS